MKRDKYFSSLLHSICEGLNSFFSSEAQKKICAAVKRKPYLLPLKNGHRQMTLELKPRMGSEVEYNDFMREARSRNIKVAATDIWFFGI